MGTSLRVVVMDDALVINSIVAVDGGGSVLERGLGEVLRAAYSDLESVEVTREPATRFAELLESPGAWNASDTDLLVLTNRGEIDATPAHDAAESQSQLEQIAAAVSNRCHVAVFNTFTVDPADAVHSYYDVSETRPLRIHRHNLALIDASLSVDLSIVDVDALVGQLGALEHGTDGYSPTAYAAFRDTLADIVEDRGLLHSGPPWAGDAIAHARLVVPRFWDRRVTAGTLSKWHKTDRTPLRAGDRIFDISVSGLEFRVREDEDDLEPGRGARGKAADKKQRSMTITVKAGAPGYLQTTLSEPGDDVHIGDTIGVVSNHEDEAPPGETVGLGRFRVVAEALGR